jgi:hypothetical protein
MLQGGSYSFAPLSKAYQDYPSGGQITQWKNPAGPGIAQLPGAAAGVAGTTAQSALDKIGLGGLGTLIDDLLGGFGKGWKAILTIIGGVLLIGVAIVLISRRQVAAAL